jgi:uncharacterized protein
LNAACSKPFRNLCAPFSQPKGWLFFVVSTVSTIGNFFSLRHCLRAVLAPASDVTGACPEAHGLIAQAVRIPTAQGLGLFAWFVPSVCGQPWQVSSPAVVLLHGWGGNASNLLPAAQALHRAGYAVLLMESRNHGRSDAGDHSSLPRFAEDLDRALDWLRTQKCVDAQRLVALGHSVGGAAVLLCASRRHDLRAAISVAAFAHPEQLMRRWLASRRVPYWPVGWLVNRYLETVIGARFDDIAPVNTLAKTRCPVLLVHGLQDDTVPIADARRILQSRKRGDVTLMECGGTHDAFDDPKAVASRIVSFLSALHR